MRLKVRLEVTVGQWIKSNVGLCICGVILNYLGDWVMKLKVRLEVTVGQWIESNIGLCIDVGSF